MKKIVSIFLFSLFVKTTMAQATSEKTDSYQVERACMDYIEGFYEGDTAKLIRCLQPALYKFGYWKNTKTGIYEPDGQMTYREAIDYAKRVLNKKAFAKPGDPKKVEVLNIMHTIAAAKVTARWGVDFVLLAKQGGSWMISEVLWEGPLQN